MEISESEEGTSDFSQCPDQFRQSSRMKQIKRMEPIGLSRTICVRLPAQLNPFLLLPAQLDTRSVEWQRI